MNKRLIIEQVDNGFIVIQYDGGKSVSQYVFTDANEELLSRVQFLLQDHKKITDKLISVLGKGA